MVCQRLPGGVQSGQSPLLYWALDSYSAGSTQVLRSVAWTMVVNGAGAALAGLVAVLLHNVVARVSGGIKISVV